MQVYVGCRLIKGIGSNWGLFNYGIFMKTQWLLVIRSGFDIVWQMGEGGGEKINLAKSTRYAWDLHKVPGWWFRDKYTMTAE